jgi:hypothetical protein
VIKRVSFTSLTACFSLLMDLCLSMTDAILMPTTRAYSCYRMIDPFLNRFFCLT